MRIQETITLKVGMGDVHSLMPCSKVNTLQKSYYMWFSIFGYSIYRPFGFLALKDFKIIWLSKILALSVPDEGL